MSRKGIKIEAQRGFETASEVIKPQRAEEQKILKVELLDLDGNKLTKPLSYGQTVVAKATCTGLEYQMINLTLWEDDAKGSGHSPINQKNRATTKTVEVKRGIAKKSFKLMPSFDKMAKAFQTNGGEGKTHEYYVTATIQDLQGVSNNIDVNALEEPAPTVKKKVPVIDPKKPNIPKPNAPTKPSVKKEITDVKLIKTSETALKVHVYHNGLQGKKIRFKLMENDGGALFDDELINQVFDLPKNSDCLYIDIDLKKVSKSKGDDMLEGSEQELFVDIEVLETASHHKTATLNVNNSGFGTDPVDDSNKVVKVGATEKTEGKSCGEKYCIKKGDKSELIREINIRLAGFGGNVPTDEFTDRTEKMIKQFQRDYMKVPETGKVCGNVLRAIDDFSLKFDLSNTLWGQMKCSCSNKGQVVSSKLRGITEKNNCVGWGDHTGKGTYKTTPNVEANHNYEYPGIHRSLLFGIKALQFYFSKQTVYTLDHITSGYRCRFKNYKTTNHQGKAIDIQFSKGTRQVRGEDRTNLPILEDIRDEFYIKYLGAQKNWPAKNLFSTEPIDLRYYPDRSVRYDYTFSWLHIDVRQFEAVYLDDKYFCKSSASLNGKSIVQLAKESGFQNTCMCFGGKDFVSNTPKTNPSNTCEEKFKKIAPIILKHEGGYVNHPNDKGGPTNKGITQATWNKYAQSDVNKEPTLDNLKKITDSDATKIYWKRYWEPKGFCKINDEKVSLMIYDWTITSGGAIKQVQKLLKSEFAKNIAVDGGMGPITIDAINSVEDQEKFLNRIAEIRKQYYTDLTFTKGVKNSQVVFLKGWHNRVDDCLKYKP